MYARGKDHILLQQGPTRSFPRVHKIQLGTSVLMLLSNQLHTHEGEQLVKRRTSERVSLLFHHNHTSLLCTFHSPSNEDDLHILLFLLLLFSHFLLLCTKGMAQEKEWRFHAPVNARTHHSTRRTCCCFHNPDHASSTLLFPITPSIYP